MISFKCFLIKKKGGGREGNGGEGRGMEGRAGYACVCAWRRAPYLVQRWSCSGFLYKETLKHAISEGIAVLRCSDISLVTWIRKFALNHFEGKEGLFLPLHSLFGWRMLGGKEAHIFVVKSLEKREMWRREMVEWDIEGEKIQHQIEIHQADPR